MPIWHLFCFVVNGLISSHLFFYFIFCRKAYPLHHCFSNLTLPQKEKFMDAPLCGGLLEISSTFLVVKIFYFFFLCFIYFSISFKQVHILSVFNILKFLYLHFWCFLFIFFSLLNIFLSLLYYQMICKIRPTAKEQISKM